MNILFYLIRYPGIGGIERNTSLISNKMCEDGHNVSILSVIHDNVCAGNTRATVYSMPNDKEWLAPENFVFAEDVIRKGCFDAIVYMDSNARIEKIICTLSKKYSIPLYVFERSSPLYFFKIFHLKPFFSINGIKQRICLPKVLYIEFSRKPRILRYSSKYVVLSKYFIPEMARILGVSPSNKKLTYINNPVIYSPISKDELASKQNTVLAVCQLMGFKRVDLMLDIWKKLDINDWKFIIVGDGPLRKNLEDKVHSEEISNVQFIGYANPYEYYKKAKIFLMTSSFEGWALTLVEAMQCGCVPVAFNTYSALPDIIQDNETGLIIPEKDESSYINAIKHLMTNDADRNRMALNAIDYVKKFDINIIINDWYRLLGCQNQIHKE